MINARIMTIHRLRLSFPAFYMPQSRVRLRGIHPIRSYHPHHFLKAPYSTTQFSASPQMDPIRHLLCRSGEPDSSLVHLSCARCQDVSSPILSDTFPNEIVSNYFLNESKQEPRLVSSDLHHNYIENVSDLYSVLSCVGHQSSTFQSRCRQKYSLACPPFQSSSLVSSTPTDSQFHFSRASTSQTPKMCSNNPFMSTKNPPIMSARNTSFVPTRNTPFMSARSASLVPARDFSLGGFYVALAQSAPVQTAQGLLLGLHQWVPWWAVIALATLSMRALLVLPLAVHQAQVVARLANINAELAKVAPELNREVSIARRLYGWDELQAKRVFKKQLRDIYQRSVVRDNCHPFKTALLVGIQIPLWVCLSVSLRNLTLMADTGTSSAQLLKSEGMLWFPDLTAVDPILIPLLLLTVNLALTEFHALRQVGKGSLLQKVLLNGSRVIIVFVAAAATINPSSVSFYWLCSSSFGLCQGLLLLSPRVRRLLRIPRMGKESANPFRDVADNLKRRLRM